MRGSGGEGRERDHIGQVRDISYTNFYISIYETLFRPKVHSKLENQTLDSVWNPSKRMRMVLKGGGGVFMSRPVVLFTGGKYDDK